MAYIGREPQVGNFQVCDAISVVNGQAAYTMQVNSVNVSPETANHMLVSLNGVLQAPGSSYTVSGSTITFASNLVTGDVIDFIHILGSVLDLGVPSDSTVSTAKIVDDAVTAAKLNADIISGQTELATAPADTDEFLVSDAGTIKRIDYSLIKGGGITEADQWRLTADLDITSSSDTFITSNLERVDTSGWGKIGTGMTESSGVFTFASTGVYLVRSIAQFYVADDARYIANTIYVTTNNSSYTKMSANYGFIKITQSSNTYITVPTETLIDVTDTSNVKVKFAVSRVNPNTAKLNGNTDETYSSFTFIRLGDT